MMNMFNAACGKSEKQKETVPSYIFYLFFMVPWNVWRKQEMCEHAVAAYFRIDLDVWTH